VRRVVWRVVGATEVLSSDAPQLEGGSVGNDLIDRAHPDSAAKITFIDRDLVFHAAGKVVSWDVFTGRAGAMRMQVWRLA
jgi:hypothetical protein